MIKLICINFEGGITMAKNVSSKKTNRANNRPNCLKVTKRSQKVNLQQVKVKDENGNVIKVRLSAREIRALKNAN